MKVHVLCSQSWCDMYTGGLLNCVRCRRWCRRHRVWDIDADVSPRSETQRVPRDEREVVDTHLSFAEASSSGVIANPRNWKRKKRMRKSRVIMKRALFAQRRHCWNRHSLNETHVNVQDKFRVALGAVDVLQNVGAVMRTLLRGHMLQINNPQLQLPLPSPCLSSLLLPTPPKLLICSTVVLRTH